MSELRDLLHEHADRADLAPLDPVGLERAGAARVRRRRTSVVAAAAVAVLVVAGGVAAVTARSHHDSRPAVVSSLPVTWAEGSTIHVGDTALDVGRPVARYVRTRDGFVFTGPTGEVWSVVGSRVTRVGQTAGPLVGDPDGDLAGWLDGTARTLSLVLLDQATGSVTTTPGRSRSAVVLAPGYYVEGSVIAIDGDTAYWRDGDRVVTDTLRDATAAAVTAVPRDGTLLTVAGGVAITEDMQTGQVTARRVDGSGSTVLPGATTGGPVLSPDGALLTLEPLRDQPLRIWDTGSGRAWSVDLQAWSADPVEWLDSDTLVVLSAATQHSDYRLLVCPAGSSADVGQCAVAVPDLGEGPTTGGNGSSFALPTGDYYFPYPHG